MTEAERKVLRLRIDEAKRLLVGTAERACGWCGDRFKPENKRQVYCCTACRAEEAAERRRRSTIRQRNLRPNP